MKILKKLINNTYKSRTQLWNTYQRSTNLPEMCFHSIFRFCMNFPFYFCFSFDTYICSFDSVAIFIYFHFFFDMFTDIDCLTATNLLDMLDNGVILIHLARLIQQKAQECVLSGQAKGVSPHFSYWTASARRLLKCLTFKKRFPFERIVVVSKLFKIRKWYQITITYWNLRNGCYHCYHLWEKFHCERLPKVHYLF